MSSRADDNALRQLLHSQPEAIQEASKILARIRSLTGPTSDLRTNGTALVPISALLACEELGLEAVTELSAQKAAYLNVPTFNRCLTSARSLLAQKASSVSPQKSSPPKSPQPTASFESLSKQYGASRPVVQEMRAVQQDFNRAVKSSPSNHTPIDDPRYVSAIFYWTMTTLKYPMDKEAFCEEADLQSHQLDSILRMLNQTCISRRAALEKNTMLHNHRMSSSPAKASSPSKPSPNSLKRKAPDTVTTPENSPTKRPYRPSPLKNMTRAESDEDEEDVEAVLLLEKPADVASSSAAPVAASPPLDDADTLDVAPAPSSPQASPEPEEARPKSSRPAASGRRRPVFMDSMGPSHDDNMDEIDRFLKLKAEMLKQGWDELSDSDAENEGGGEAPIEEDQL